MPRGIRFKLLRKAAAFVSGELSAGELGVNTADKRLAFSTNGTDVVIVSANAPYVVKYNTGTSAWPARPNTTRVVFWLALSDTAPRPTDALDYDVVFRGAT